MEHRPLLPKPPREPDRVPSSSGPEIATSIVLRKRTKAPGRTSCDACRKRKSACGGQRPVCSTCQARGTECSYKNRDKTASAELDKGILERLRTLPESESIALLYKLRGESPDLLSPIAGTDSQQLFRGQAAERAVPTPPFSKLDVPLATTATGIDLELTTRYPIAYPTLMPVDLENLDIEAFLEPSSQTRQTVTDEYCDDRLSQLDMSKWSNVRIDSTLAARILSIYLSIDHPVLGLFDADLFLRDLISLERNFCSPMLQSYSSREPAAAVFKVPFFEEAIRLWESEQHRNTLCSVATSHFITMTAACHGKHDVSAYYLEESIAMSTRMGLYGATEESSAKHWLDNHQEWIRAASHTAWGAYCAATNISLRHQTALVKASPLLPIPSKIGAVIERVKGERYDSYPTPSYMGQTFNKYCELNRIAHKVLWVYYGGDTSPSSRVTVEFAEDSLRELLDWSASLPLELVRTDSSPHRVILLHTYFHCLVLDMIRPLHQMTEHPKLSRFEASDSGSVEVVYQASVFQIKRLVLFYLTKYDVATYCILWQPTLIYLFNALIREFKASKACKETPEWDFYFRLCMKGLKRQFHCFALTEEVVKGLLSMAVRDGVLQTAEADRAFDDMRQKPTGVTEMGHTDFDLAGNGDALIVLDLDLAITNRTRATLSALTAAFDDLAMDTGGTDGGNNPTAVDRPGGLATANYHPRNPQSDPRGNGGDKSAGKRAAPDEGFPTEDLEAGDL